MKLRAFYTIIGGALLLTGAISMVNARQTSPQIQVQTSDEPAVLDEGPLVPPGEPPDLALLYTGGVVGYVEPCG